MEWGTPAAKIAIWLVPIVWGFGWYAFAARKRARGLLVDAAMESRVMPRRSRTRSGLKLFLLSGGLACLVVAACRPRYGERYETVSAEGIDVFILLDVSRSMLAEDVAPNRLERAKLDLLDLLPRLEGDRVGLIVFAGAPVVQVPLTADLAYFRATLDQIDTESAPRGGSLVGDTIRKGLAAMPPEVGRDRALILITDGEDQESFPLEAAAAAGEAGVPVITVGLGDNQDGARIPIRDENGQLRFVEFDGQEIWSRMNDEVLREIALTSGGAFIPAGTQAYDLGQVYEDHLSELTRGKLESRRRLIYRERFQLFVLVGFALLMVERMISPFASLQPLHELMKESA